MKVPTTIATSISLTFSFLSLLLLIVTIPAWTDSLAGIGGKVMATLYYFGCTVASSIGIYGIFKDPRILPYYIRLLGLFILVSLIQMTSSTLMLLNGREAAINHCFKWVAFNPGDAPRQPDCANAVTVSIWIAFSIYLTGALVHFTAYKLVNKYRKTIFAPILDLGDIKVDKLNSPISSDGFFPKNDTDDITEDKDDTVVNGGTVVSAKSLDMMDDKDDTVINGGTVDDVNIEPPQPIFQIMAPTLERKYNTYETLEYKDPNPFPHSLSERPVFVRRQSMHNDLTPFSSERIGSILVRDRRPSDSILFHPPTIDRRPAAPPSFLAHDPLPQPVVIPRRTTSKEEGELERPIPKRTTSREDSEPLDTELDEIEDKLLEIVSTRRPSAASSRRSHHSIIGERTHSIIGERTHSMIGERRPQSPMLAPHQAERRPQSPMASHQRPQSPMLAPHQGERRPQSPLVSHHRPQSPYQKRQSNVSVTPSTRRHSNFTSDE